MKLRIFSLLALILCCGWPAAAQWPYVPVVQSNSKAQNAASITCVFNNNVATGNYGIILMQWFNVNTAPTVTDTLTSTYTQRLLDTSHTERVAVYTTTFASSGANTVTFAEASGQFMSITCVEMLPLFSLTVDVSAVTTWSGSPATITSPSITTTLNSDFIFVLAANDNSAGFQNIQTADVGTWYPVGAASGNDGQSVVFRIGGAAVAGNQITLDNSEAQGTLASIAFKSNSLAITSPATAPDGDTAHAYDWTAQAAGGAGSYTWSVISGALPTGLSINASTGRITGTPTVSNNYSATIQASDGTHTGSQAISFKIGTTQNTIAFVQGKTAATGAGSSSITFTSNVTSGNVILLEQSWSSTLFQVNNCADSLGTVFKTYVLYPYKQASAGLGGFIQIMAGIATSTGADTVTCGSTLLLSVGEFTNVNFLAMDNIVATRGTNASPATITTNSLTTLVPNELLYGSCGGATLASDLTAVNSPFTRVGNTTLQQTEGYNFSTTVTGYTMSCNQTNNGSAIWLMSLMGLRPSAGAVVPPVSRGFPIVASLTKVAQN